MNGAWGNEMIKDAASVNSRNEYDFSARSRDTNTCDIHVIGHTLLKRDIGHSPFTI